MQRTGEFSGKLAAINTCRAVISGFVQARKGSIPSLKCPGIYCSDAVFYGIPKCDMQDIQAHTCCKIHETLPFSY